MLQLIAELARTPLPTLLAIGGLLFLFMSVVSKFGANIVVNPQRQKLAGLIGVVLLAGGISLYYLRPSTAGLTSSLPTETPPSEEGPPDAVPDDHPPEPQDVPPEPHAGSSEGGPENLAGAWLSGDYEGAFEYFEFATTRGGDPRERELARRRLEWLSPHRGRIVFADDLEDNTLEAEPRWTLHPPGHRPERRGYARVRVHDNFVLVGRGHSHAEANLRADLVPGGFEITLRFRPLRPGHDRVHINIAMGEAEGRTSIGLDVGGKRISFWEEYRGRETVADEPRPFASRWYELRAVIDGRRAEIHIDGEPALDYTSRRPRIILTNFNIEVVSGAVQFDDVLVVAH